MEEFAKLKKLDYHYEKSEEFYVRFYLNNPKWQDKIWIGFTFEANRCSYGICNDPSIYRISQENIKIIHESLKDLDVNLLKESNWWPFYSYYPNLSLENWESDIINSDIFLNECKEKITKLLVALEAITL